MIKRRTLFALAVLAVVLVPGAAAVTHAQQLAPGAHSSATATPSATVATGTSATMGVATSAGLSGTSTASPVASTSSAATDPSTAPPTDPATTPPTDPATTPPATPPPTAGADECTDDCGDSTLVGSIAVGSPPPGDLSTLATTTVEAATAAALAGDPTATVDEVHLTVVNGYLVYEVEMTNGAEYLIDAGNAAILLAEAADPGTPDADDEEAEDDDEDDDEDEAGDTEDEQEDSEEDDSDDD
jgi:hypothetical protein